MSAKERAKYEKKLAKYDTEAVKTFGLKGAAGGGGDGLEKKKHDVDYQLKQIDKIKEAGGGKNFAALEGAAGERGKKQKF